MVLDYWIAYGVVFCGCLIYLSVFSDGNDWVDIFGRIVDSLVMPSIMVASFGWFIDLLELIS